MKKRNIPSSFGSLLLLTLSCSVALAAPAGSARDESSASRHQPSDRLVVHVGAVRRPQILGDGLAALDRDSRMMARDLVVLDRDGHRRAVDLHRLHEVERDDVLVQIRVANDPQRVEYLLFRDGHG